MIQKNKVWKEFFCCNSKYKKKFQCIQQKSNKATTPNRTEQKINRPAATGIRPYS